MKKVIEEMETSLETSMGIVPQSGLFAFVNHNLPSVKLQSSCGNFFFSRSKSTISMAIFNSQYSYVTNLQRVPQKSTEFLSRLQGVQAGRPWPERMSCSHILMVYYG